MKRQVRKASETLKWLCMLIAVAGMPLVTSLLATGCAETNYQETVGEQVDDADISARIRATFGEDQQYKFRDVKVTTSKGRVQLGGFAGSDGEKDRAEEIASKTPGVKDVINNITIK